MCKQWWKNCASVCMCLHACVCKYALKNAWKHAWTMLTAHSPISSEMLWSYWERSPLKMMNQSSPTLFHFPWKVQMWWPKGDNFKHPHTWHPYNASCFHYGNLSVSLWDTVTLQLVCGDALSCSALSDLLPFRASLSYSVYFSFFFIILCITLPVLKTLFWDKRKKTVMPLALGKIERWHGSFTMTVST